MHFCEPGDWYSQAWLSGGFSRCFLELVGCISAAGVLFLVGCSSLVLLPVKGNAHVRFPWLCLWESFLSVLLAVSSALDLVVKGVLHVSGDEIYGYVIVVDTVGIISWMFATALLYRERLHVLQNKPHGLALVLFWVLNGVWLSLQVASWGSSKWWWSLRTVADVSDLVIFTCRVVLLLLVFLFGVFRPLCCRGRAGYSLLVNLDDSDQHQQQQQHQREGTFVTEKKSSTFGDIWHKTKVIFPYVFPRGHPLLQLKVLVCFLILVGGRVINVYVPIYYKKIVNALTPNYGNTTDHLDLQYGWTDSATGITFPLTSIIIYIFLRFLQGGSVGSMGFSNNLRSFLWIQVQQYTSRTLQIDLFSHLHCLSLRWHLGRKTGEVLRVMDRGTQSITNLLNYILFNIVPTLVDILVAVVYFIITFDGWFGLIVFTTMAGYILVTIHITEWRTRFRRSMNEKDNETRTKAVDSLINFETVKYYGAESYEVNRVTTAIVNYQTAEWNSLVSLNILGFAQNVIITLGLLVGSALCAYRVVQGVLTVGDFVLYCTYIIQLYSPLNFFGTYYRMIQQAFIDMENMFDLLDVHPEITDRVNAEPIVGNGGRIEFQNVYFHYQPEKPILRDITFTIEPGETFALVGPSGVGKSTIIRLLFRFYDIQDGVITIDGQDIRSVTQSSLRSYIGVVPQDTVLFNDDIRYNIRYGRTAASDEEVERSADCADMHRRILSFPLQYGTVVGERGLKLSGGEKQRVAIARTILKAPAIILLDEATSALDTETERNIQSSLISVCRDRTTLIVAHRLSTIIHADQILVLKDGVICERGKHADLLLRGGVYSNMWTQQLHSLDTSNITMETSMNKLELSTKF